MEAAHLCFIINNNNNTMNSKIKTQDSIIFNKNGVTYSCLVIEQSEKAVKVAIDSKVVYNVNTMKSNAVYDRVAWIPKSAIVCESYIRNDASFDGLYTTKDWFNKSTFEWKTYLEK